MKETREWTLESLGLQIAMISWGQPCKPRVLLLHGHGDSAATFAPLVRLLPDGYYVSFDFPGHGKSAYLPSGPLPTHTLFLEIIRRVVQHLQWESFICIGHSMGGVLAMLHDNLHPGQVTQLVCLDPMFALLRYTNMADHDSKFVNLMFYERYYDHFYHRFCQPTLLTYEEAIDSVVQLRKLSREQAEVVSSRSLAPVGGGLYKSLCLYDDRSSQHRVVCFEGNHDHHIVQPEMFVPYIVQFLEDSIKSKL